MKRMSFHWYALRSRRFPAGRIAFGKGQTPKLGQRAMITRIARPRAAALVLTAVLAACGASKDAAPARGGDTARTSSDSAAGSVSAATGPRDTTWGPRNTMGRIPVLEYHVIGDHEGQYTITREHFLKDLQLVYD